MRELLCADCGLPFARIRDGTLVVEAYHRGQRHVCSVTVLELVFQNLVDQAKRIDEQREEIERLKIDLEAKARAAQGRRQTSI